jgi:hypothetical protein
MDFQLSVNEAAVYQWGREHSVLLVGIYVYIYDIIITDTEQAEVKAFKVQMKGTFQMGDLGLLCFHLGIEVH